METAMKTILITGGTGLVAKAQVQYLLDKGYRVVITYRSDEKLKAAGFSGNLVAVRIDDFLAEDAVGGLIDELSKRDCLPDVLVNNACDGRWHYMERDGHVPEECFLNHYRINVIVPYELSWRLVNLEKSRLTKIINVSSMYGVVPHNPNLYLNPEVETPLQYSLAKAALNHLTKDLAVRFRDKGVFVNAISYGGVEGRVDESFKKRFEILTPLRRMMKPEETIPALQFLIEEDSGYMTGQNIIVDGGRTIW